MNVADYIVKFLADYQVDTVFMITGGQAMFLNDAVYRNKKIKAVFNHHEQAAGMAAEAYGRISQKLGVAMVTAGPGTINVLSGVVGGWVDSAPMMIISGQSNTSSVKYMEDTEIRQFGLQGINTKSLAKKFTKYFVSLDDPTKVLYHLEKAYWLAKTGRSGPVWIEVPLDIQRAQINEKVQEHWEAELIKSDRRKLKAAVSKTLDAIFRSKRPLLLAGQGVRIAEAQGIFTQILSRLKIPTVTTRLGIDLIESDHELFVGRPGLYPDRAANFAVQNADLIIILGARLDTGIIGYDAHDWGRHAKKIVVEIDKEELDKPGINIDLKIASDVGEFLEELLWQIKKKKLPDFGRWIDICSNWKKRYSIVLPEYKKERLVNSYFFAERLSKLADKNDVVVVDTSSPFHVVCQAWSIKRGQRLLTTGGISTMGYWPSSIGACLAKNGRRTIVITGDGSLQMNSGELATIKQNKLPIKIFVINNNGYLLIRHTQKTWMEGRLMGESPQSGLWSPDILEIAKTYKIHGCRINSTSEVNKKVKEVLNYPGPVLCDVKSPKWQLVIPRISSSRQPDGSFVSRPYEDLFPFLDEDELKSNMIAEKE